MDMLTVIYNALLADEFIAQQAKGRIKYYEYPQSGEVKAPYIVIDPLDVPLITDFADNTWMAEDFMYQIDVWTNDRLLTKKISARVQEIMWKLGFGQKGGTDQHDSGVYRDARRYRGKAYRETIK